MPQLEVDKTSVTVAVGIGADVNFKVPGQANSRSYIVDDTAVARVLPTDTGIQIFGLAPGGTGVGIEDDGQSATVHVQVTPPILTNVQLDPARVDLAVGDTTTVACIGTYSDTSAFDVSAEAEWSVDDATVATVDHGTVTPLRAGSTTLRASYHGSTIDGVLEVHDGTTIRRASGYPQR